MRHLFAIASAISLLLFIATVTLWARSYSHDDSITIRPDPNECVVCVASGNLWLEKDCSWPDLNDPAWGRDYDMQVCGFGRRAGNVNHVSSDYSVVSARYTKFWFIPMWFPCLLFVIIPVARLLGIRGHGSFASDRVCAVCGYDLTGNTSGVCPECGTPPPEKPEAIT